MCYSYALLLYRRHKTVFSQCKFVKRTEILGTKKTEIPGTKKTEILGTKKTEILGTI